MTLVAGCYERFIFGFGLPLDTSKAQVLAKRFAYPGHQGAVKCLTAGGTYVVSGGADDQLHIYDTEGQKDLGFLMNPGEGAISAVALYAPPGVGAPTHLFSGGADGTLAVWSAGRSWDCLKVMTGHRKEITSLSIHPSGKLALSTSRDSTLRIWDLIKGRCSYHHILEAIADMVAFSPSGSLYALVAGSKVTVHQIGKEAGLLGELVHSRRVLCMAWNTDDVLLTGTEAGSIHVWDVSSSTQICEKVKAHQTRLRGLTVTAQTAAQPASSDIQSPALEQQTQCTVASAASDGSVKMWHFSPNKRDGALQIVSEISTGARLTCLSLVHHQPSMLQTRKQPGKANRQLHKQMRKASAGQVKKQKRSVVAADAKPRQPVLPKPDLKKVGVAKNGIVDFTVDAQHVMQTDKLPVGWKKSFNKH
ncbi:TPA: hypothetical protein ACH3X2_005782 [Trebouxia sp. C0005]